MVIKVVRSMWVSSLSCLDLRDENLPLLRSYMKDPSALTGKLLWTCFVFIFITYDFMKTSKQDHFQIPRTFQIEKKNHVALHQVLRRSVRCIQGALPKWQEYSAQVSHLH